MTLNSMAFFVVTPANITVIVLRNKWNVKNSRECNFQFLLQIQHMLTVFDVLGEWFWRYKKYLKNTKWTGFTSNIWWKLTKWAIWNWWKLTKRLLALLLRTECIHITSW